MDILKKKPFEMSCLEINDSIKLWECKPVGMLNQLFYIPILFGVEKYLFQL